MNLNNSNVLRNDACVRPTAADRRGERMKKCVRVQNEKNTREYYRLSYNLRRAIRRKSRRILQQNIENVNSYNKTYVYTDLD